MKALDRAAITNFKRKVREGTLYLDTEPNYDTAELRDVLNNVLVWLTDLEEKMEEKEK